MSVDGGSTVASLESGKRQAKKKHYPFGTPSHVYHAYSEFNHLKPDDYLLFHALSTAENINPEIRTGNEERNRPVPTKKEIEEIMKDIPAPPEGVEPCKRLECKLVIKNIITCQSLNRIERDELLLDIDQVQAENLKADRDLLALESKLNIVTRQNDQLEATLEHLLAQIEKLENKKIELQQEREEKSNRMMVTETEKQNCIHQLQLAEKALADAMWRGKRATPAPPPEEMDIVRRATAFVDDAHSVARTSYGTLAHDRTLDHSERPSGSILSSLPDYLKNQLLPQSTAAFEDMASASLPSKFKFSTSRSGVWNMEQQSRLLSGGTSTVAERSVRLGGSSSTGRLMPLPTSSAENTRRRVRKLHKDISPHLELPEDAYRGYTPSGSPNNRARASMDMTFGRARGSGLRDMSLSRSLGGHLDSGKSVSMSSLGTASISDFSNLGFDEPQRSWDKLDPIFYDNTTLSSFSRGSKAAVGVQRARASQSDFTQLLTHKHPGFPKGMKL